MKQQKAFWLLGLTVGATLPLAQPAQAGLFGLSEQDEIRAGQQVAAQAQKEYGRALPASNPMQRRVRAIGMQFARLSGRKNIPYSYTVLQNDKVLNAFAAPGGPIFVTTKLVKTTTNDAELAYVLGHETAHIDRRHIVAQVEKQQKAGLIAGVLGAVLGRGNGGNAIGAIANVGWAVVSSGYSRKDENEADAVGARFMSQLGYDPRAAVSMLAKLDTGSRGGGLDKYLSTHPAPKSRQAAVSQQITRENLLDVARRAGGPRLTMAGNAYAPTAYPSDTSSSDTSDRYPDEPGNDSSTALYPPDNDSVEYSNDEEINFGAPLRLRSAVESNESIVMAPVAGFARWAGATVSGDGVDVTMRRGTQTLELRRNSTVAYLNDRSVMMSAAAVEYNGILYAPVALLAQATGARATLDNDSHLVRFSLSRRTGYARVP
ncbi:MAG TPA: M48 family metalloprotease [Abditibacteriaceae bacterium]|jgi:Zn-dependent protease with chaperone function